MTNTNDNIIDNTVFINGLLEKINSVVSQEQLMSIKNVLNQYVDDYSIIQKHYSITVRQDEKPQAYKHFLVSKKIEGLSDTTIKHYKEKLDYFFKNVMIPVEEITSQTIQVFLYNYSKEIHGTSATCVPTGHTINQYQAVLSSFFGWCKANGYITKNPCENLNAVKYKKKEIDVLTDRQVNEMIKCCDTISTNKVECLRAKAIVETFISTGVRVSELVDIKLSDFDWNVSNDKLVSLKIESGKGNKERTVFLTDNAVIAILDYVDVRNSDSEYLFVRTTNGNGKLTTRTVQNIITKLGNMIGVDGVHPHQLRHTVATELAKKEMPINLVQKMLGHTSSSTTTGYYVKAEEEQLEKEIQEKLN